MPSPQCPRWAAPTHPPDSMLWVRVGRNAPKRLSGGRPWRTVATPLLCRNGGYRFAGGAGPPGAPPAIVIKTALFGAIGVPDKHETVGTRTPACSEKAWKSDQNTLCSASFRARARRQCRVRISNYNIEPGGAGGCCSAGLASLRRVCMESL